MIADPASVQTLPAFARACKLLMGARAYSDLPIAKATLSNLLNGRSVPERATVANFLTGCGLTADADRRPWLDAWDRVRTADLRRPAGAHRVRDARARWLGVHACIQVDGASGEVPVYVPRDLDAELRPAIADAAVSGGFVLLVGRSSVGKTRAMFEAVREVLPDWWLVCPDPTEPATARALVAEPTPRTVLWLDELQRFIDHPGGLSAGAMRSLLAAGVVVLATLWPDEYAKRVTPRPSGDADPTGRDRARLLGLARVVDVPDAFTAAERRRADDLAGGDQRIRVALDTPDVGPTQVLAAGPELVRWWEHAPNPYGRAVVTAALDARRVGARGPLSREYLTAAAPAYLTSAERAVAPEDWLDRALAYALTPLKGAAATLSPVAAGMGRVAGHIVADYLHQYARRVRRAVPLPDEVWQALVDHSHPDDVDDLGHSANRRGRPQIAEAFFRRGTRFGDRSAAESLALRLRAEQRVDELREHADQHGGSFANELANLLLRTGDTDEAVGYLRLGADTDDWNAQNTLSRTLRDRGEVAELHRRAVAGDQFALLQWFEHLKERQRLDEAIAVLRPLSDAGNPNARWMLIVAMTELGLVDDVRRLADSGDVQAAESLARLFDRLGRPDEALDVLRALADAGNLDAEESLAWRLAEQGRLDELARRAEAGDPHAAISLYGLSANAGRIDDLRRAADRGDAFAITELIGVLERDGSTDALRAWAVTGDSHALLALANVLARQGRTGELRERADAGDTKATLRLAGVLADDGRIDEAIAVLAPLAAQRGNVTVRDEPPTNDWDELDDLDSRHAVMETHRLLIARGSVDEAVARLRRDADLGHWYAHETLVDVLVANGRHAELQDEVNAGTPGAALRLADLQATSGPATSSSPLSISQRTDSSTASSGS